MPAAASPPRPTVPAIVYVGGDPSLDLVNTVDWTSAGLQHDRIPSYRRFVAWAEGAGVVSRRQGKRLRAAARARPRRARGALARVHQARGTLQALFTAAASDRGTALHRLNPLLAHALAHLELAAAGARTRLTWRGLGAELDSPLWPVVWAAARLLDSPEADRIRICGGIDCGWVYVDRSRNGLRRWCEMAICGTRAKSRRRAARRRGRSAAD